MRSVRESYRGSSVRVFRLDADGCLARLGERARALLDADPEVLEVILFGSLARGDARPGSDADLVIVLRESKLPFLERIGRFQRHWSGVGLGCDLFPYTSSEMETLRGQGNPLIRAADRQGRVLARR